MRTHRTQISYNGESQWLIENHSTHNRKWSMLKFACKLKCCCWIYLPTVLVKLIMLSPTSSAIISSLSVSFQLCIIFYLFFVFFSVFSFLFLFSVFYMFFFLFFISIFCIVGLAAVVGVGGYFSCESNQKIIMKWHTLKWRNIILFEILILVFLLNQTLEHL